ncbi:MAG: cytochrome b/b6 domain-containing protein [Rhodospirillales bacterium]|nr:cytochrome b/b6 domain-containing protein [Rhodospirillales bacterium]
MAERAYIMPIALRLWHWTNALLMILLIISGASLHFTDPVIPLIRFDIARTIHNVSGIGVSVLYIFFAVWNSATGSWRQYIPELKGLKANLDRQNYYVFVGQLKGDAPHVVPTPEQKFNAMQQLTYIGVMYIAMPVVIVTGLAFFYPELAPAQLFGFDGLLPIAVLHYVAGFGLTMFLLGHLYMGTTGTTVAGGFRMMITGWHDEHDEKPENEQP